MCLIAYIPKDGKFPMKHLETIVDNNPHGFGMMWIEGNKLRHIKGLFDMEEIKYMMEDGPKQGVAYHWRYRTRGEVSEEQAHPFVIEDSIGIMHNGTMSNIKASTTESDSKIFANGLEKTYNKYGAKMVLSDEIRTPLEDIIGVGNRVFMMGMLKGKKTIRFLNSKEWKIVEGIPMSNTYSLIKTLRSYTYKKSNKEICGFDDSAAYGSITRLY